MNHDEDPDELLLSLDVTRERLRELLSLPPELQQRLDRQLASECADEDPTLLAARDRLLARISPPATMIEFLEGRGVRLWGSTSRALERFVTSTSEAAESIRDTFHGAIEALAPTHLGSSADDDPQAQRIALRIHAWGGRMAPRETECSVCIDWVGAGELHLRVYLRPVNVRDYPGLARGFALLQTGVREGTAGGFGFPAPIRGLLAGPDGGWILTASLPAPGHRYGGGEDGRRIMDAGGMLLVLFEAQLAG